MRSSPRFQSCSFVLVRAAGPRMRTATARGHRLFEMAGSRCSHGWTTATEAHLIYVWLASAVGVSLGEKQLGKSYLQNLWPLCSTSAEGVFRLPDADALSVTQNSKGKSLDPPGDRSQLKNAAKSDPQFFRGTTYPSIS